jgi:hypothetical protein
MPKDKESKKEVIKDKVVTNDELLKYIDTNTQEIENIIEYINSIRLDLDKCLDRLGLIK